MDFSKFITLGLIAGTFISTCNGFIVRQNRTDVKRKIEGGEPISIDKVPYQVYLKETGSNYFCGGVLIRPNIVLTAAHCVEDIFTELFVVAGTDNADHTAKVSGRIEIQAQDYLIHPQYNRKSKEAMLKYDFAIVQLESDFPETKNISPIKITTVDVKKGDELLVTGIGRDGPKSVSKYLKAYKPKVIDCKGPFLSSYLKLSLENYDGLICYKSSSGDRTRIGDSGDPVVNSEGQLVGIHTSSYANDFQAGINVLYYLDWIRNIIGLYTNEIVYKNC